MGYRHDYVNHSIGEYARGEVHINNCENRASILRPWLSAHRGISKDNLDTYLSLFQPEKHKQTTNNREDQANSKDIKTHQQTMD
jgi:transposase-like protein